MIYIYIAGDVSHTKDFVKRFQETKDRLDMMIQKFTGLTKSDYKIINPVDYNKTLGNLPSGEYAPRAMYMDVDLSLLRHCDYIYFIEGWQKSKGAVLEDAYAAYYGIKVLTDKKIENGEVIPC